MRSSVSWEDSYPLHPPCGACIITHTVYVLTHTVRVGVLSFKRVPPQVKLAFHVLVKLKAA